MDIQAEESKRKIQIKLLQINPIKMYTCVQQIYIHPLHFTHLVHKEDNYIYLYDELSMSKLGKTKVQILAGMKLFAFSYNFNLFFGLKEGEFIMAFQLQKDGYIIHKKLNLSPTSNMDLLYLQAHTFACIDQCSKLVCVNSSKMYFLDALSGHVTYIPQLKYQQKAIQSEHSVKISNFDWIIGCQNYVYSVSFNQNLTSFNINNRIQVGRIKKIGSDQSRNHSKYGYAINQKNQVTIFIIHSKSKILKILQKINFSDSQCLYVNFFKFSINTSTTNKFFNQLYIIFYCKKQLTFQMPLIKTQMQQESLQNFKKEEELVQRYEQFQQITSNQHFNYIMTLQVNQQGQNSVFTKTRYLMRNMPQIKTAPWLNDLVQNGYFYLCATGQTAMIDFSGIKQFGVRAQQWVCLGYRFQALTKNEIYQQKIDQFQQEENENSQQVQITQDILDSFEQSGLPQYLIIKNKINRLRCFQL